MAATKQVIAERLRALREERAQSYKQAADFIGVDERTYGRWAREDDPTIPMPGSVEKIASAYGIDPLEITGSGDSPFDRRLVRIEQLLIALSLDAGLNVEAILADADLRSDEASGGPSPAGG